jgi:hypothetical protein
MKHLILICISVFLLTACGAQDTPVIAADVRLAFAIEPDPPTVGAATLYFTVLEADSTPIDGATVTIIGNMEHEGMMPVNGATSESNNGVYAIPFDWTMGGGWILNVTVMLPDNRGIVADQFELSVGAVSQDSIINRSNQP